MTEQRIFFGSLEHVEKERLEKLESGGDDKKEKMDIEPTTTATPTTSSTTTTTTTVTTTVASETLPFSEKTTESLERHKKLLEELELQKRMREIPVPTNDELVKARLVELLEPMILFAEGKPERRERLRRILAERGITQTMPSTVRRQQPAPVEEYTQQEAFLVPGPKELKEARMYLLQSSLEAAKKRLKAQREKVEDLERNWDVYEKNYESLHQKLSKFSEFSSQVGDTRPLSAVSFSPDGKLLATSSWTGLCKVWDVKTSACQLVLKGHNERAQDIAFYPKITSPSSLCLASCGADNKVMLWSLESEKPIKTLTGHTDRVNRVVFHPSARWLATTSYDKTWGLWDAETGQELLTQGGYSRAVYGLSFHCDGALVATGGLDAVGRVWDLRSGRPIWNFRGHAKQIIGVDFAPNGYQIASGSDDRTVRIWDLRKRKTSYIVPAHGHLISSIKYQPIYGNYLITSSYDKTCKIFATKNWNLLKTFSGHEGKVTGIDMCPNEDGSPVQAYQVPPRFVSTSFDRTWKVWEYDPLLQIL